jgi:hypothetical protein
MISRVNVCPLLRTKRTLPVSSGRLQMMRPAPPDDSKTRARRRRRTADTARWRSRRRRGVQLFQIEAGPSEYDLAIRYGGLKDTQVCNKAAVSSALGRLLRKALAALLRESDRR